MQILQPKVTCSDLSVDAHKNNECSFSLLCSSLTNCSILCVLYGGYFYFNRTYQCQFFSNFEKDSWSVSETIPFHSPCWDIIAFKSAVASYSAISVFLLRRKWTRRGDWSAQVVIASYPSSDLDTFVVKSVNIEPHLSVVISKRSGRLKTYLCSFLDTGVSSSNHNSSVHPFSYDFSNIYVQMALVPLKSEVSGHAGVCTRCINFVTVGRWTYNFTGCII